MGKKLIRFLDKNCNFNVKTKYFKWNIEKLN